MRQWGKHGETALCRYLAVRSVQKEERPRSECRLSSLFLMLIERRLSRKGQRPVVGQLTLAPRASHGSPGVAAVMWLVLSMVGEEEYGAKKLRLVVTVGLM